MSQTVTTKPERIYLTPEELSARYNGEVSVKTLANWRTNGSGPEFTRVGGKVLYPIEKVVKWETSRTVRSTSQYAGR